MIWGSVPLQGTTEPAQVELNLPMLKLCGVLPATTSENAMDFNLLFFLTVHQIGRIFLRGAPQNLLHYETAAGQIRQ